MSLGPKKNFTFQHQRLEIDALVPPSTQQETNVKEQFPYDKLQYADLLKIADDRVNKLKLDLDGLRGENEKSKELVESLRKQVTFVW